MKLEEMEIKCEQFKQKTKDLLRFANVSRICTWLAIIYYAERIKFCRKGTPSALLTLWKG